MASGRGAVVAAVFGNLFLATIKVVAFALSGSGAMLSEAIHSAADTGNQVLLYLGIRRSERPADAMFHYGYGAERFLFALLSAVGIFILGCGVTVYHGIHTLVDPPELRLSWVTVAVLAVSFCVDGAVFVTAVRAIAAAKGKKSFWQHIRTSSDPTVLAVLFEDFVATLGVVVAAVGIGLAHWTGNPLWDGISSIFIGLLLGAVAVWLGWRNRVLILGPAIPADVTAQAVAFLESQPAVEGVRAVKTRIVSADRFRLRADVDYNGRELGRRHAAWLRAQIAAGADPDTIAAEFGERVLDTLADEIQRIERELKQRVPQLRHIDFETDEFAG